MKCDGCHHVCVHCSYQKLHVFLDYVFRCDAIVDDVWSFSIKMAPSAELASGSEMSGETHWHSRLFASVVSVTFRTCSLCMLEASEATEVLDVPEMMGCVQLRMLDVPEVMRCMRLCLCWRCWRCWRCRRCRRCRRCWRC